MSEGRHDLVIVGGGLAAVRTAQSSRDGGFTGSILMLSEESERPYDRPPLSKEFLLGQLPDSALDLLPPERYDQLNIELRLGRAASALDVSTRQVTVDAAESIGYERLVIATGCRPRRLDSVADAADVCYLRSAGDARRLGPQLRAGASVVIVGGGFIGLEVASAAVSRGCSVTVIEALERPLVNVVGPTVAGWLQDWHTARGVAFRCGVTITGESPGNRAGRVTLSDGSRLDADVMVIGIGIQRELEWLAAAGLAVHAGLVCDEDGRTNIADVFGVGDIACRHRGDRCTPIQHWTAAVESAQRVGSVLAGSEPFVGADEAFFWSNQTELRLQSVGHCPPGAVATIDWGSLESGKFVAVYEVDGVMSGVFAANTPREFLARRRQLREVIAPSAP